MLTYRTNIYIISIMLIIIVLIGSIGIPAITNNIRDTENELIMIELNTKSASVLTKIESNISALGNYQSNTMRGMEEIYQFSEETNIYNISKFQNLAKEPSELSGFNITRTNYFRIINTPYELDAHIEFGKKLYNVSSFEPYNLINGSAVPITNATFPLVLLLVIDPFGSSPGLPTFGSFNAISVGGNETVSITQFSNRESSMSEVLRILRVDGSFNTIITFNTKLNSMMTTSQFNVNNFLSGTLKTNIESNDIIIEIADEEGIFYSANTNITRSDIKTISVIEFAFRNWTVTITASESFKNNYVTNAAFIIEIVLSLVLILIFILIIGIVNYMTINAKNQLLAHKIESMKKMEVIQKSNNIIIHELRNVLQSTHMIIFMKDKDTITEEEFMIVKFGISKIVEIVSKVLDYQQLLSISYIPRYEYISIIDIIDNTIKQYPFINIRLIYSDDIPDMCQIDRLKFQELVHNGLNNSSKYSFNKNITVRCQTVKNVKDSNNATVDGILVEILNKGGTVNNFDNDLFIPFFMKNNDGEYDNDLWGDTIEILSLNYIVQDSLSPYFGISELSNIKEYIKENEYDNIDFNTPSSGLGLSIARLITRAFKGECGLMYDEKTNMVRYWFFLPYVNIDDTDEHIDIIESIV